MLAGLSCVNNYQFKDICVNNEKFRNLVVVHPD